MAAQTVVDFLRLAGQMPPTRQSLSTPIVSSPNKPPDVNQQYSALRNELADKGYAADDLWSYFQKYVGAGTEMPKERERRFELMQGFAQDLADLEGLPMSATNRRKINMDFAIKRGMDLRNQNVPLEPLIDQFPLEKPQKEELLRRLGRDPVEEPYAEAVDKRIEKEMNPKAEKPAPAKEAEPAPASSEKGPQDSPMDRRMTAEDAVELPPLNAPKATPVAEPAAEPAAKPAAEADPTTLEALFRTAHGTSFDPKSSMDAKKMSQIKELYGQKENMKLSPNQFALKLYREYDYL